MPKDKLIKIYFCELLERKIKNFKFNRILKKSRKFLNIEEDILIHNFKMIIK